MKPILLRALNILFAMVAVVGFSIYALRMADSVDLSRLSSPRAMLGIGAAAFASALIIPVSAFAWMHMLRSCSVQQRWGELATIMGLTQLGKYLPGNVAQHVGRLAMSLKAGIHAVPFTTTVVSESLLAILAAMLFGSVACAVGGISVLDAPMIDGIPAAATLPLLLLAASIALLLVVVSPRLINRIVRSRLGAQTAIVPAPRSLLLAFLCYVGNYLIFAAGIWVMAHLLFDQVPSTWLLTGSFALSWIFGFLLPGAPAGLGVREAAMLGILQAAGGGPELLILVIGLRVATTLGDLLCFLAALATSRLMPSRPTETND